MSECSAVVRLQVVHPVPAFFIFQNAGGKYIFDLLISIISVSLKTQELIAQLPEYKEI